MSREKNIILAARVVSMVFTPFYLPIVGLMALFFLSYLSLMPTAYKLQVLTLVYFFTILLPTVLIHLYRKYNGWNLIELGHREKRMVPYVISILCYFFCVYIMDMLHIPHFMGTIVSAALAIQIVCALINVWWLCLVMILAGVMGTSRMILRQHSLAQVVAGFWVGVICSVLGLLYL